MLEVFENQVVSMDLIFINRIHLVPLKEVAQDSHADRVGGARRFSGPIIGCIID